MYQYIDTGLFHTYIAQIENNVFLINQFQKIIGACKQIKLGAVFISKR